MFGVHSIYIFMNVCLCDVAGQARQQLQCKCLSVSPALICIRGLLHESRFGLSEPTICRAVTCPCSHTRAPRRRRASCSSGPRCTQMYACCLKFCFPPAASRLSARPAASPTPPASVAQTEATDAALRELLDARAARAALAYGEQGRLSAFIVLAPRARSLAGS